MARLTSLLQSMPQMARKIRRPTHSFKLKTIPWVIQPFLLAPVLPGETLKQAFLQSRCVTDPIKSPLTGWWNEYYLFYVKHRDLDNRDEFSAMMVDPAWTAAAVADTTLYPPAYFSGDVGQNWINWGRQCRKRVIETYFRLEGELEADFQVLDGGFNHPVAQVGNDSWLDSATLTQPTLPDVASVDLDASGVISASEIDRALAMWAHLREAGMTQQTYEEYLRTYGVNIADEVVEEHKPELIRFVREWSYPSNTIDPATGAASSAVSWSIAERADKDRFFREPGFVFGVTVKRPKVLLDNQSGNAAALMNDVMSWLPSAFEHLALASFKQVAGGVGPVKTTGATPPAYWVDLSDLLLYGDQFANFDLKTVDGVSAVALPNTATMAKRYLTDIAEIKSLFVDPLKYFVNEDGVVNLQIASRQRETSGTAYSATPTVPVMGS